MKNIYEGISIHSLEHTPTAFKFSVTSELSGYTNYRSILRPTPNDCLQEDLRAAFGQEVRHAIKTLRCWEIFDGVLDEDEDVGFDNG